MECEFCRYAIYENENNGIKRVVGCQKENYLTEDELDGRIECSKFKKESE